MEADVSLRERKSALSLEIGRHHTTHPADTGPGHQTTDGSHVGEPVEHLAGSSGSDRHEGEERESDSDSDGSPGKSPRVDLAEELGGVAVESEAVEGAGRGLRNEKSVSSSAQFEHEN